jgi:hypothetical protein
MYFLKEMESGSALAFCLKETVYNANLNGITESVRRLANQRGGKEHDVS